MMNNKPEFIHMKECDSIHFDPFLHKFIQRLLIILTPIILYLGVGFILYRFTIVPIGICWFGFGWVAAIGMMAYLDEIKDKV